MKKSRKRHALPYAPPSEMPESLAALAGKMADDFNNILTTIMGACSLIDRDDPANDELLQCMALVRASAERATVLSARLMGASMPKGALISSAVQKKCGPADISVRDKKTIH